MLHIVLAPAEYPKNLIGHNTSSTSIRISWNHINEDAWNGPKGGYYLKYESLKDPQDKDTIKLL